MLNNVHAFLQNQDAAVTVDWVVLTASIVGLTIAMLAMLETSLVESIEALFVRVNDFLE